METIQLKYINLSTEMMTAELIIKEIPFTALEVYPTTNIINADTVDPITNLKYKVSVPANDTLLLSFTSTKAKEDNDVIIDWGDKLTTNFSDYDFSKEHESYVYNESTKFYKIYITHKYTGDSLNIRNIVKIFGRDYFLIRGDYEKLTGSNIICRALDTDLPISDTVTNASALFYNSYVLLKIKIPYMFKTNILNWANMFGNCKNLLYVDISDEIVGLKNIFDASGIFRDCENLLTSNYRLPSQASNNGNVYYTYTGCKNLSSNIEDLLPKTGFSCPIMNIAGAFYKCENLKGRVPDYILQNSGNYFITNSVDGQVLVDLADLPEDECIVALKLPLFRTTLPDLPAATVEIGSQLPPLSELTDENIGKYYYSARDYEENGKFIKSGDIKKLVKTGSVFEYLDICNTIIDKYYLTLTFDDKAKDTAWRPYIHYTTSTTGTLMYKQLVSGFDTYFLSLTDGNYLRNKIYKVNQESGNYKFVVYKDMNYALNAGQAIAYKDNTKYGINKYDLITIGNKVGTDNKSKLCWTQLNFNVGSTFYYCNDEIRNQIPKFLGGKQENPKTEKPYDFSDIEWSLSSTSYTKVLSDLANKFKITLKA